jgi:hypothetical protein
MRFATGFCLTAALVLPVGLQGCLRKPLVYGDKTASVPHVPQSALVVQTSNGAVSASASMDVQDVQIKARIGAETQARLDATTILTERLPEGVLRVSVNWAEGERKGSESASFTIIMPDAKGVTVSTTNGAIALIGLAGPANVTTSNGALTFTNHAGPIEGKTSNGAVTVKGASESVTVKTSNGAMDVTLAEGNASPVKLTTSNGSIKLSVGAAWAGAVNADTSNGNIRVMGQTVKDGETKVGEGAATATLKTSNGTITVDRAK